MRTAIAILIALTAAACGPSNNGQSNNGQSNNGQSNNGQSNNGQSNNDQSNNGQSNSGQSNNGTTGDNAATNNATSGTNNATSGTNNATSGTNNATSGTNNATSGCPDPLEPNDAKADATPADSGDSFDTRLCNDDDLDLFAVELTSGQTLTATATFDAATHNIDMTLFDADQADDYSTGDIGIAYTADIGDVPEVLEHTVDADGTYYLLVFNNNFVAADYSIEFDIQ